MRHSLELAHKSESELAAAFNTELSRAVRHIERRSDAARDIIRMHKRHGDVVSRILEQEVRANAAGIIGGTLNQTSLLAMVATRQHLADTSRTLSEPTGDGNTKGKAILPGSDEACVAAILASLQNLHDKIDAGPLRKLPKNTNARPKRRDSILFAAITLGLEGMKYCAFLRDHGVSPRWEPPCPSNYDAGYKAGQPWQKKIQDEKCRAKARMKGHTDAALVDAFNFFLPDRFEELSRLLKLAQLAPRE